MGTTPPCGTHRKEIAVSEMIAIETSKGNCLINALIARQRCFELGMITEAQIYEETIQRLKIELSQVGLDPDHVIEERVRLLTEAIKNKV